ncbi:sigma factor-like helix-turn-helix DNA-binding protein [Paenibacillus alvei]|uniref:sigma factor-like helix-turn-helix DNA-binding protein n=1 Tax=Paenibacillus alvei TaxID=44250 RepID=UPI00068594B7
MLAKESAHDEVEKKMIGEMISSTQFSLDWITKGFHPENRRGIHRRSVAQRTIPINPLYMQSFASPGSCGSYTTLSDYQRFQIEDAMSELTEQERQVFTLHRGLGFSLRQIALEMDLTKSSVQTCLERAEEKITRKKQNSFFLTG